jgi:hypothetical protein
MDARLRHHAGRSTVARRLVVSGVLDELREACAAVAARSRHVRIERRAVAPYAASLACPTAAAQPPLPPPPADRETLAAFWLTLDAINFGSGWFPTLRKRPGSSGYHTIAAALRERFDAAGPWTAGELRRMTAGEIAATLGQDSGHELMELFARSLQDLGARVLAEHGGSFSAVVDSARGSAAALVERLAGWDCFADTSAYDGLVLPFLKRAQIAAADLHRAGVARFDDLDRLTMFADNLVPHVLRLDGVLRFDRGLRERIERGELLEHGSVEEVEIRAVALHAVELIVAAGRPSLGMCAAEVDELLWRRGQGGRYKAVPRHRARCTAY